LAPVDFKTLFWYHTQDETSLNKEAGGPIRFFCFLKLKNQNPQEIL
jgi:hypothetical protein